MGQRSDDDIYDAVEADKELSRYENSLLDEPEPEVSIEVCTNCGSYHSENHDRCGRCQRI